MLTRIKTWTLIAGMACIAVTANASDTEGIVRLGGSQSTEGVVRLSDSAGPVVRGQSPEGQQASYSEGESAASESVVCPEYCPTYCGRGTGIFNGPGMFNGPLNNYFAYQASLYRSRNLAASAQIRANAEINTMQAAQIARCKFGYFIPTGCGGAGCSPFGAYRMVYPVDPSHFDQRDGQVYAASGYGGPVAVPIAPNVEHTYNYGWGMPSSRLTPISHPLQ
ncbi:MAG: hypothetical protein R3C18_17840 [Planctomycetaceae bacterium]